MLNKVQLIGRLGADPEVKHLENGVAVARIRMATTETYKDKEGNRQELTEWHTVIAWRGLAEVAEKYMHKGDLIYVEGKINNREYQSQSGEKKYSTEIKADNISMLGGKREGGGGGNRPPMPGEESEPMRRDNSPGYVDNGGSADMPTAPAANDDLPF